MRTAIKVIAYIWILGAVVAVIGASTLDDPVMSFLSGLFFAFLGILGFLVLAWANRKDDPD
ncbi:MAG: hypothetical protein CMJ45_11230 [Planctomyces sp.]|jgi:hypothetical protein|nr:hypothetical protein [Planctomyces sp.]|tara:strand:- start:562 stop:744 length:183 start_codon:yes stop_codon:yes gene_type:complete